MAPTKTSPNGAQDHDNNTVSPTTCQKADDGNSVLIRMPSGDFTFHSHWLHDVRCDGPLGAARDSETAICAQPQQSTLKVISADIRSKGKSRTLSIAWDNGETSNFPAEWLEVMAPLVASKPPGTTAIKPTELNKGWTVDKLEIPSISYKAIFKDGISQEALDELTLTVIDHLLLPTSPGMIRMVDLPDPVMEDELAHVNNINTVVLKKLFGSVFVHPTRGSDKSFNVSSREQEAEKRKELPNYNTNLLLLPHADHAFYEQPIQIQGWYILEGESENTWVSVPAALETLKKEAPESYEALCRTPMSLGRVSAFYGEPVFQMTVDTTVTMIPGTNQFKRVRWHPNFIGSLLCPYDQYDEARLAQQKFLEIMRRPSHQLKVHIGPGDYFIWDNYRVLHGREKVFSNPRTGVGQTVTEQVVHDKYRSICIKKLRGLIDEQWLVHLPMAQLRQMLQLFQEKH